MTAKRQALIPWVITGIALLGLIGPPILAQTNVANSAADLAGKILMVADSATGRTVSNLFTFDRGAAVPFAVGATSLKVTNLDADKVDGIDGASFATLTGSQTLTNKTITAPIFSGSATGTYTLAGVPTITSPTISGPTISGTLAGATSTWSGTVTSTGTIFPLGLVDASGASAGQFKFPGTQNASANVNTLDDYEEGTWTPVLGGNGGTSGQTYTTQVGTYVKVGKLVVATGYLQLSAKGTITGNVIVDGLPFTAAATYAGAAIGRWQQFATSFVSLNGWVNSGGSSIVIEGVTAAAVSTSLLTTTDVANNTNIMVSCSYIAAN